MSPEGLRESNIAIKASFRKSLGEHTYVSRRDAPRLAMVSKHHFRQRVLGNLFKGLGSQSTQSGLHCSYPVTGPHRDAQGPFVGAVPDQAAVRARAVREGPPRGVWYVCANSDILLLVAWRLRPSGR